MISMVLFLYESNTNTQKHHMPIDDGKFIHIVGMYKCGTSWLSHIFAAHPDVIAWREFDIIRATHTELSHPIRNRITYRAARLLKLPPPNMPTSRFISKSKEEMIQEIFCGRGWIPIMSEEKRARASALNYSDSGQFLDTLMALGGKKLRRDEGPLLRPERCSNVLGAVNSRRTDLVNFLDAIKTSSDASLTTHHFFKFLQDQCDPGTPIVLKAADQLVSLRQLQQLSPHSRKIAIIRDGRDAAISAVHYRKLMLKRDAPWAHKEEAFLGQLRGWATRARMLAAWAEKNDIIILRYEDLHRDFYGVCGKLFEMMEIAASPDVLNDIYQKTNFKVMTGGREADETPEQVVRKGITGEWKSSLDKRTANLAWRISGRELERFGYARDGEYLDGIPSILSPGYRQLKAPLN